MSDETRLPSLEPPKSNKQQSSAKNTAISLQQVLQEERAALGGDKIQRSALCISGGGIRSATFALGALQGLAQLGILEKFDYLSTVSGG
ncbi:MAG TPA: hypothetical protein VFB79_08705, partial [Candidatus Angelobacter sp.]|nr:hypothetical protein [Candidatus Angelobacter sp.]